MFEMLSNAQNLRLEEQRGVHVSPGEMPSFLYEESDRDGEFAFIYPDQIYHVDPNSDAIDLDQTITNVESPNSAFHALTPNNDTGVVNQSSEWNMHSLSLLSTPGQDKWKSLTDKRLSYSGLTSTPRKMSPVVVDSLNNAASSPTVPLTAATHQSIIDLEGIKPSKNDTKDHLHESISDASRLSGNLSSHFPSDSHAFRPLHTSNSSNTNVTTSAPIASPDHFVSSNKKLSNSELLPNKLSPSSSSNGSNNSHTSPNMLSPPPPGCKNIQRLSETMLVHKIHLALKEKENQQEVMDRNGTQSDRQINMKKSISEVNNEQFRWPPASPFVTDNDDSTQTLLSPRCNPNSFQDGKSTKDSQPISSTVDSTHNKISTRHQQNPFPIHTDWTAEPPVTPSTEISSFIPAVRQVTQVQNGNSSFIDKPPALPTTYVMAGPTQTLVQSHTDQRNSSPRSETPINSMTIPRPPYRSPPAYTTVVKLEEETVTFV